MNPLDMFNQTDTYLGASVTRIIPDDTLPDSVKAAMATAVFSGTDIVDSILDLCSSNLPAKVKQMHRLVRSGVGMGGAPRGNIASNTIGYDEVREYIQSLEASPIEIKYIHFGPNRYLHSAWQELTQQYGYIEGTNKIGTLSQQLGFDVFVWDMKVKYPTSQVDTSAIYRRSRNLEMPAHLRSAPGRQVVLPSGKYPSRNIVQDASISYAQVAVEYVGLNQGVKVDGVFYIYTPVMSENTTCFQAKYVVGGQVKYFTYIYGSGGIPVLDDIQASPLEDYFDFLPNIYFRWGGESIENSSLYAGYYLDEEKKAKCVGLPYRNLLDAIQSNPNVEFIESAFVGFGIPADSTNALELKYLFEFFDVWRKTQSNEIGIYKDNLADPYDVAFGLQYSDAQNDVVLKSRGIHKKTNVESIGEIGTVVYSSGVLPEGFKVRTYKKQITSTLCHQLDVIDLISIVDITGTKEDLIVGDAGEEILLIPLSMDIAGKFNIRDEEGLYARSMHLICYSVQVVETKWYQREEFKTILTIFAVAMTLASLGSDGGTLLQAATYLTSGYYVSLVVLIAWELVTIYVYATLAKYAVKAVGVDLAFLAALIALAYAPFAGEGFSTVLGQVTAKELLILATGLVSGIQIELDGLNKDIQKEYELTLKYQAEKQEELLSTQKLLETNSLLSPMTVFGESPDHYFQRTIHTGNIGRLVFDDLHNFVDRSLQLPKFSTTIEGFV